MLLFEWNKEIYKVGSKMCAIFQLAKEDNEEIKYIADEITRRYGGEAAEKCFNADLYPKSAAPVIGPQHKVALMRFGFPVKDEKNVVFNARAETLTQKAMFRTSLSNRCLVPATAFYEFDKDKKKHRFIPESGGIIYFAALWKPYFHENKKVFDFCIITTQPNEQIGKIHSRMPAIIAAADSSEWLEGDMTALELLKPLERGIVMSGI